MNESKYKALLYFISLVILATLSIQLYWNYKNYQTSKQQLINDVQTSLDNAVDEYYAKLAKENSFEIMEDHFGMELEFSEGLHINKDSIQIIIADTSTSYGFLSSRDQRFSNTLSMMKSKLTDTVNGFFMIDDSIRVELSTDSIAAYYKNLKKPVETLTSKIIVSISEDALSLPKIDSLFKIELDRKEIALDYGLTHTSLNKASTELRADMIEKATLHTASKSPFFHYGNKLDAHFTNVTSAVLRKNLVGMLLSFLLVGSVIVCLLYLLKIIRQQKQLAEVKNDLISNITHEFKTPIATIGIAMEAIQSFNTENDIEKNLRYAKISSEQVSKLNVMVEKLLETATLDSEELDLNLENTDVVELLRKATRREEIALENKQISFSSSSEVILQKLDVFHFENSINNIIDNAIKYGGSKISVEIKQTKELEITIRDSGNSLTDAHKKQVFEKFYRVPKGNTHDVKGFGIGLYYTKKIIEKHNGQVQLDLNPSTTFKITLPNE